MKQKCFSSLALVGLCLGLNVDAFAAGTSASVTIDYPAEGAVITGPITVTGTFKNAYNPTVFINADSKSYAPYINDVGTDQGHWSYYFDPSGYNGAVRIQVSVQNSFVDTQYKAYGAQLVRNITVNLPKYAAPTATITAPADGSTVATGTVPITFTASAAQGSIASAQIQIDLGAWIPVTGTGGTYTYNWNTSALGSGVHCIKAQVTDANGNSFTTLTTYAKTGTPTNVPLKAMQDRAMWIWDATNFLANPNGKYVLDEFCRTKGVKTLYYYVDIWNIVDRQTQMQAFNKWAHQNGYTVFALLGCSNQYNEPAFQRGTIDEVEAVLNYNLIATDPDFRFDGINDDSEPGGLPEWLNSDDALKVAWLNKLQWMMNRKAKAGSTLLIGAAVQRGLDSNNDCLNVTWNGKTANMNVHVQNTLDYIAIMDYKNVASGTGGQIDGATGEITYGSSIGKPVVIGSETDWIVPSMDPQKISYRYNGTTAMETQLQQVATAFYGKTSYAGLAVHHLDSYMEEPTDRWYRNGANWTIGYLYYQLFGRVRVFNGGSNFWKTTVTDSQNPNAPVLTKCFAVDFQRIDLKWPESNDDTWVDHYELHRSKTSGFTPSDSTLANLIGDTNRVLDTGLMPSTTYYYKVIAVDLAGKKSTPSNEMSATTAASTLKPMYVSDIQCVATSSGATGKIKIVDQNGVALSGVGVMAGFDGGAGDKKGDGNTGSDGYYSWNSESLTSPFTVFVAPLYVRKLGYYWAKSMDLKKVAYGGYPQN